MNPFVYFFLLLASAALPCSPIAAGSLNDTGITRFSDDSDNNLSYEPDAYPGQDAGYGRDLRAVADTLSKVGGGDAGFDFTKIAGNGSELSADAVAAEGDWACTRDNVSGLLWEVKTRDLGLRDGQNTYTWFNPDASANGGDAGVEDGGSCGGGISCDTHAYINAVNQATLCGYEDWRLPRKAELRSIVHHGRSSPSIDDAYFPGIYTSVFWTGSPRATSSGYFWVVDFENGNSMLRFKSTTLSVRLVRGDEQ